jgi:hypothetical protein
MIFLSRWGWAVINYPDGDGQSSIIQMGMGSHQRPIVKIQYNFVAFEIILNSGMILSDDYCKSIH